MKKQNFKGLFFSLAVCAAMSAQAAVVPVEDAKALASEFMGAAGEERLTSADALELSYTQESAGKPVYYVFNSRDGQGYIIMSADDCTTTPVLAYSTEGRYEPAAVPPAMQWMMKGLESEIKDAPNVSRPQTKAARRSVVRRNANTNQRILLQTADWSQEAPFNNMIPGHPLVGCVGTAMSIIMKYHNWPERGNGSYNGVNFDVEYDWDNMLTSNYRFVNATPEQTNAVAQLFYHAAVSIGTQFGYSGSSAYEVKVPAALVNYFNYDPGISFKKRAETRTQAEFDRIVENEIRANRPVLYCGQDMTMGHAFVVDGYDPLSGMIHVNWGWAGAPGNSNGGWYTTTMLNPTVSQSHNFSYLTTVIYNIKPGKGNNAAWSPLHITADGGQAGMGSDLSGDLTPGREFTVRAGNIKNLSYERFSGKITVALFAADGTFKSALSKIDGFSLDGMAIFSRAYADFRCSLPAEVTVDDGDMIRLATSDDNGQTWKPVAGELLTVNEIPAKGAVPGYFAVGHNDVAGATFTGADKVIRGWNYTFNVTPANPANDVVTVKANGYVLTPDANYNYTVANVLANQEIAIYVQNAADVKEKRSIWVGEPGTLETILSGPDAATVKDLTLFGTIDARDFTYIRSAMKLTRLDMSAARVVAYQSNPANAIPREAFKGLGQLREVVLPNSVNRFNNGAFRYAGIERIVIPAAVSTYEYNVFNGCSRLRDVWVNNPNPAFVNWCVFIGSPKDRTVHCPDDAATARYSSDKNWHQSPDDDNVKFVTGRYPVATDLAFAVMEDKAVKFTCDTEPGRCAAGTKVNFKAEYALQDDKRMAVYANSTLLTPDAEGNYSVDINSNTIVHFDIIEPTAARMGSSAWTITDTDGTVGMLTDAVNVFRGVPFAIRINSFRVVESAFWAAVLTTADGRIKEFISPVSAWSGNLGAGLKMTVNCCVKESDVREGNLIRMATSYNKRQWSIVEGSSADVVAALPAINNQTPVYNFTFTEGLEQKAVTSGLVASAVRGRDLTFRITPRSARDRINVSLNGEELYKGVASFNYSFIAKQDMNFDIEVYTPEAATNVTYEVTPGTLKSKVNRNNLAPSVTIIGDVYATDLISTFQQDFFQKTVKYLDLQQVNILETPDLKAADGKSPLYPANTLPKHTFYESSTAQAVPELLEVKLPKTIVQFQAESFNGCEKIKELELPENLYNGVGLEKKSSSSATYGIEKWTFLGCTSLTTLYVPCSPRYLASCAYDEDCNGTYIVSHIKQNLQPSSQDIGFGKNSEGGRNSKITVVVKPEYLQNYLAKTPAQAKESAYYYSPYNYWLAMGFNIVGEYPVYGVNFDNSRCFVADENINVTKAASFLSDNIPLESMDFSGKVFVGALTEGNRPEGVDAYNPTAKVKIYDNGKLMAADAIAADGSLNLTFWNPNKHADLSGNHNIEVAYLYDVRFNLASANLKIVPEIRNNQAEQGDMATEFEVFNTADAAAPVVENVREGSTLRFKVELADVDLSQITGIVKQGETILTVDEQGYYNIDVADGNVDVAIYAVPRNGATLTAEHLDVIDAEEAKDVTSISLAGDIDSQKVKEVIDQLPAIEQLDLSALTTALPAQAMAGNETLTTVILPAAEYIEAGTFKGCTNLSAVSVPECVNVIAEDAFADCPSLETISFTGIQSIGANAFAGCSNLTTIMFNDQRDAAPKKVRRRVETAQTSGFSANAFDGLNPNCLVYLDESQQAPADVQANYIKVETVDVEGSKTRVYKALGNITLDPAYSFSVVNAFTVPEGQNISMDLELTTSEGSANWRPLLLPFAPATVETAEGDALAQFTDGKAALDPDKQYFMAGTLAPDAEGFSLSAEPVKANTPYLAAMHKDSRAATVRFSAQNTTVDQTPEDIRINGKDFALVASYGVREVPAATTFKLSGSGSAFISEADVQPETFAAAGEEVATTTVEPFSVYLEAPADAASVYDVNIDLSGDDKTGIEGIAADGDGADLRITRDGNCLTIFSATERDLNVYGVDGRLVLSLHLNAGANTVENLDRGYYVVDDRKISL